MDRYDGPKAIFIADRGYESINSFVKVGMKNHKYLIRVKDIHSRTSVLRSFGPFPDAEFDMHVRRTLTTKQTNEIKAHPEIYKFVPKNQRFDFSTEALILILNVVLYVSKLVMTPTKVLLQI